MLLLAGLTSIFRAEAGDVTNVVAELTLLTVTNSSVGLEASTNTLAYSLVDPPVGAVVDTNGVITWTPTEAQGPATNTIIAVVTDGTASVTNHFVVDVTEVNVPPAAFNDSFVVSDASLTVTAPGVKANDTDSDLPANTLTAVVVSGPTNGVLNLSSNGGFVYTPNSGFIGTDAFTYTVNDGWTNSAPATATLTVLEQPFRITALTIASGLATVSWNSKTGNTYRLLYKDDLTASNWNRVTGDTTATSTTTNKTTFVGQATRRFYRVQLVTNTAPELPVQGLRTIAELSTLSVTNTATDADLPDELLTYSLLNAPPNAAISADGVITWTPTEAQGPTTNNFTTMVTDHGGLSATNSFSVIVTEVNQPSQLPDQTNVFVIAELTLLTVTNMATDLDEPANTLTYSLVNAPVGAVVDGDGVITWTPSEAQGQTTNTITTVASDGSDSVTNSFLVIVTEVNRAPSLPLIGQQTIPELVTLNITNTATDLDEPADTLTYSLLNAPANAAISVTGVITWTPTEAQGPGTNLFTTVVTDNGGLGDTNSFIVVVTEVNLSPSLAVIGEQTVAELTTLIVTNTATDMDEPVGPLTYSLISAPANAAISTNGVITWMPSEVQGPATNTLTTVVSDGIASATNSFVVVVTEVNQPPTLGAIGQQTVAELTTLTVTNAATDLDEPANPLTYSLVDAPSGALVDTNGVISWTPTESQGPTTNLFTTVAIDNGGLSATNSFTVIVAEVNQPPVLGVIGQQTVAELTTLTVTNAATDLDQPANTLTYSLIAPPSGVTISTNGVITWTPTEAQGPGTNTLTTVVSDGTASVTNSFSVVVTEVNLAPTLGVIGQQTVAELTTLTVTNVATDLDQPTNTLTYSMIAPPAGAAISINGVITWTPTEAEGPATNILTTVVSDGIASATNSFLVVVTEVNQAPTLGVIGQQTVAELTTLTVTNVATDLDEPANTLTYSLIGPPAGAIISSNGVISWTPTEAQGPVTNTLTTVVSDGTASATNSFSVVVTEVNLSPSLPVIGQQTVAELTTLTVTNTATDLDQPANTLTYSLIAAPVGVTISTNGVITWTPSEAQGPGTNTLTTVVSDGTASATNNFVVAVTEANQPPVLGVIGQQTVAELATLTVTNVATDLDQPANTLTYALIAPPAGATISTNGVITWTPIEAQGPVTNTLTTVVSDGTASATNSFSVVVTEVNLSPSLPVIGQQTVAELATLTVTNTATDLDQPTNVLAYSLVAPPSGATISTNGVITWTPTEAQGPVTNTLTTVVSDGIANATNSFVVVVTEVNQAPTLGVIGQQTVAELTTMTVTNGATDLDQPANTLTYSLVAPPVGAAVSSNGVITWTPTEAQGPVTNTLTTVVSDGIASSTNSFVVRVLEVNIPPVAVNDNYATSNGTLTVNAPGILLNDTDADLPTNVLTAALVSGPTNGVLTLNSNGGFAYTPNFGFGGVDGFTYRAQDATSNSAPATVTITVTAPPVITGQPVSQTVVVGTNASFFVAASGSAPLSYQWRKNGTNVSGANNSLLTLSNVQTNDAGNFQVVITNIVGAVTSSVATLTVNVPGNCNLPAGMVGWWPGEGSAADTAGTNNGTLQGGATASAAAFVGLGFTFDGTNSYVSIPDAAVLKPTNLTIEAWVKFNSLDSSGSASAPAGLQYIVFKKNSRTTASEGFLLGKNRGTSGDNFFFAVTSAAGVQLDISSTTLVQTGAWYHVACVRGPNTIQLFVNGQLQSQTTVTFAQDYGNVPMMFGSSGQAFDRKFKGMLDEVSLYNRPLSSNEIAAIYAAGASGKCSGPSAPSIITQPANQTYTLNGNATFSVTAVGTAPLGYQWYRDGFLVFNDARISGATNATLAITTLQPGDIGNYSVVVSNSLGTVQSAVASLNTGVAPVNDNFGAAISIGGTSGTISGNNANATKQSGEPNHAGNTGGPSVWYNWTAPSASPVTIDTSLSAFDTLLGVYTGNAVNALTVVATNNNISTNNSRSRVTFTPVAGTVYHIAVDGAGGANGNIALRWVQSSVALPDLMILGSAVNPRIVTETFASGSCAVAEGLIPAGTRKIIRFDTQTVNQGNADLFFGNPASNPLFVYAPCHAHYHFQNYMSYRLRYANGQIAATGLKVGFCVLDVFRFSGGSAPNALYTCVNQGIQQGWGDLYDSTLDGQWIDITGLPDGSYTMEMEANPLGIIQESNYGNNVTIVPITIGNSSAPPANNNFASAQTLLGTSPSVTGTTTNATKEAGEPNHAGNAGGHSVWYNWTAPATKAVTIDTIGSAFNTLLGVYTGSAVGSLSLVSSNDDIVAGSSLQSRVTFNATAGTLYRIAVDGLNGASGNIILTLNQTVANDSFAACIFTGGILGSISGSSVGATKETNEPNHGGNTGGHSTWFCWTAPVGGTATFDTTGSTFNTLLGVYTGTSVDTLTLVAGNDDIDATTNQLSRVTFNAVGLTMYRIAIDGFNGDSGNTTLNWSLTAGGSLLSFRASALSYPEPIPGGAVMSFNLLPEGMCQLGITGKPQQRYTVERSCDLAHWVPLATTMADITGKAWFTDKSARHLQTGSGDSVCGSGQVIGVAVSATEARFYRAVEVP